MFNFLQQQQGQNDVEITHHTFIDLFFTWMWSLSLIIGGNIWSIIFLSVQFLPGRAEGRGEPQTLRGEAGHRPDLGESRSDVWEAKTSN